MCHGDKPPTIPINLTQKKGKRKKLPVVIHAEAKRKAWLTEKQTNILTNSNNKTFQM